MKDEPKIESGIPIPPRSQWVGVLEKMKVGDSIVLTRSESVGIAVAAKLHKMAVTTRQVEPNKIRVWRTL